MKLQLLLIKMNYKGRHLGPSQHSPGHSSGDSKVHMVSTLFKPFPLLELGAALLLSTQHNRDQGPGYAVNGQQALQCCWHALLGREGLGSSVGIAVCSCSIPSDGPEALGPAGTKTILRLGRD